MGFHLIDGEVVAWAKAQSEQLKFHALLCDPPYHLETIVKRFGSPDAAPAKYGTDGVFQRASKGFMGQEWDGGDVAFRAETWAAFMPLLYPGAFGMAFSSPRTYHRMAVAIEDAGFIIHPMFGWVYGQGFPKATRVKDPTFEGHRYGLQALKPALEPIVVFQKPYEERPQDDILRTGAGTLNIEAGRIPSNEPYPINTWDDNAHPFGGGAGNQYTGKVSSSRWPANLAFDNVGADALDQQSGVLKSGKMTPERHKRGKTAGTYQSPHGIYGEFNGGQLAETIGDSGGASRFFFHVDEKLEESDPFLYSKKATTPERTAGVEGEMVHHPTYKPLQLTKHLASLLLPPEKYAPRAIFVPFAGVMSEAIGASLAGWEEIVAVEMNDEYVEVGAQRIHYWNNNPLP